MNTEASYEIPMPADLSKVHLCMTVASGLITSCAALSSVQRLYVVYDPLE